MDRVLQELPRGCRAPAMGLRSTARPPSSAGPAPPPDHDRLRSLGTVRRAGSDAASDVVVSASLSEGLPRAIVEALLLGKPVVATDARGTREVVLAGKTVLVPRDACAGARPRSAGSARRSLCGPTCWACQAHVRPLFDAHVMVRLIEAQYEECLARKFGLAGERGS